MRPSPPESAPLRERVLWVLTDMDPERLGTGAAAYDAVAVLITHLLESQDRLTAEELGRLWGWALGADACLLQPAHRFVLNQLSGRLDRVRSVADDPGAAPLAGAVQELGPASTGRWLIRSRGSVHALDLDARTYERRPGPTSQVFDYDNQTVHMTRVEVWPKVGGRMLVWFDDPLHPELIEQYRMCSRIHSITPAPTPRHAPQREGRPSTKPGS